MISPRRFTILFLALLPLLLARGGTALAEDETNPGEILVVLAFEHEGETDPELAKISALRKPPFSAFRSMKVLSRTDIRLKTGKPFTFSLPNGRHLMLTLAERLKDGRSRVQLSINRPNEKDYLPLLEVKARPGELFFVAGQSYEGGTLVIGVRVGEEKPATKAPSGRPAEK